MVKRIIPFATISLVLALLVLGLGSLCMRNITTGGIDWLPLSALWGGDVQGDILWFSQIPRGVGAFVIGAGLALAGTLFQGITRNDLAGPYTLGVASGGALFVMLGVFMGSAVPHSEMLFSTFGSLLVAALILLFARSQTGSRSLSLILAGITLSMFCAALMMTLQVFASPGELSHMVRWSFGSVAWVQWSHVLLLSVALLVVATWATAKARQLDAISLDEDIAVSIGVDVRKLMTQTFLAASIVVALCVAVAGPIAFVGLLVPHGARRLAGSQHQHVLLLAPVLGGLALLVSDLISRLVMVGGIPVGATTGLLGAPLFAWLLLRKN